MIDAASGLRLVLTGVALAALPLVALARVRGSDHLRQLVWVTTLLTFDLLLVGVFTRLTDSGLGCPDWPGCYGAADPFAAQQPISAAEAALPTGPVTMTKAWIEMIHRYLAGSVGVLVLVITVQAWRTRRARAQSPWLATMILVAICLQAAFGAWTVTYRLQPVFVAAHLLGGLTTFALLLWLALRLQSARPLDTAHAIDERSLRLAGSTDRKASRLLAVAIAALFALTAQIALGAWVSANYAVLACPDFPLCQGELVPTMDFAHGFTIWRALGKTDGGAMIALPALVAIHWAHRVAAVVVFTMIALLAARLHARAQFTPLALALALALLVQITTGLSNVVLQWPLALAVMHSGGAAVLLGLLVTIVYRLTPAQLAHHDAVPTLQYHAAVPEP